MRALGKRHGTDRLVVAVARAGFGAVDGDGSSPWGRDGQFRHSALVCRGDRAAWHAADPSVEVVVGSALGRGQPWRPDCPGELAVQLADYSDSLCVGSPIDQWLHLEERHLQRLAWCGGLWSDQLAAD